MAASPTRDPLNKENDFFPVSVRAREFRLAEESRPASICSFSTFRLKVVITYGIPPAIHDDVHIHNTPSTAIDQCRIHPVTQLRTDGVHCRESTGTGPVVLKVVRVTSAAFSGFTMAQFFHAPIFSHAHTFGM